MKLYCPILRWLRTDKASLHWAAALFLEEFVGSLPWAHLDIAGPAFAEKDSPYIPKGGTGFGVRTLVHYLLSL